MIALIDSHNSHFVVPDVAYLSSVHPPLPHHTIDTANGPTSLTALGNARVSIISDDGCSQTFSIPHIWVLPSCSRVLYSQSQMHALGITYHLDEGYLLVPNGSRKNTSPSNYAIDLMFGPTPHLLLSLAWSHNLPTSSSLAATPSYHLLLPTPLLNAFCGSGWVAPAVLSGCPYLL